MVKMPEQLPEKSLSNAPIWPFFSWNTALHWQRSMLKWVKLQRKLIRFIRDVLQNEFRYDFRKGPREFSAGTVITVVKAKMHVNTVNTVPTEISRGPFRKSYRNSFCNPPPPPSPYYLTLSCLNCALYMASHQCNSIDGKAWLTERTCLPAYLVWR